MKNIVECVPNFSEGRDRAVIDQIVAAIHTIPGLFVMDVEMDADHHRCVITFVGEKERIGEGALCAIGKATELIDLNRHSGAHPRIGATDVVPFIPVRNVTLEECVAIARQVGEEAAQRFSLPIYLYEAAASRPERIQLENIRRGQFEGLRREIESLPDRVPDFGVPRIHPTAGATVIGARKFLIAYNINLNTPDVTIAKRIAKTIRFSSGGLPFVKAMGVDLKARNQAQVSMNLTDFEQTPVHRVFEMVKREAEELGVTVAGSEIIGLVPQKALEMAAEFYLQIENFRPELVFENRLNVLLEDTQELAAMKIADFLESVSATNSVPGGGSVAALAGALAAALGRMAIGFTLHKKRFESHHARLQEYRRFLEDSLAELRQAVDRDAQAYAQVVAAQQLPKTTEQEKQVREQRLQEALRCATDVPMQVAELASRVMQSLMDLRPITNPHVASDLNVGFWMALAAAEGALDNVLINLESLPESQFIATRNQRYQELKSLLKQLGTSNL